MCMYLIVITSYPMWSPSHLFGGCPSAGTIAAVFPACHMREMILLHYCRQPRHIWAFAHVVLVGFEPTTSGL